MQPNPVSTEGFVRPWLFGAGRFDLSDALGAGESSLEHILARAVNEKPKHRPLESGFKIVAR